MASYNRIIMIGNLTRDPELKQLSSGQSVCRLGLASNRQFKNRQTNQMVQEVCFIDIDVWGPQANSCSQYLKKGKSILIEGRLKLDSWQDPDGKNRSKHSIVADRVTFLSGQDNEELESSAGQEMQETATFQGLGQESQDFKPTVGMQESKKAPATAAKKTSKKPSDKVSYESEETDMSFGEVNFDASKPFEEELPF